MSLPWKFLLLFLIFQASVECVSAQTSAAADLAALRQLARSSRYIFSGTVISTELLDAQPGQSNTVRVTFRVKQGVRGVRDGETFSIREWAGLWNGGAHYLRGEQVLLFLYPPSQLGLTSPVRGP